MKVEGAFFDPPGPVVTGKQFYYVWTVINSGTLPVIRSLICTLLYTGTEPWPSGVRLVFANGHHFEGIIEGPLDPLKPLEKRTITVTLKSPPVSGVYRAEWRLADLEGRFFGGRETKDLATSYYNSLPFRGLESNCKCQ